MESAIMETKTVKVGTFDIQLEGFYTTDQVCEILNVSRVTLSRRFYDGSIRRSGHSGLILYQGSDIVDFLISRKKEFLKSKKKR